MVLGRMYVGCRSDGNIWHTHKNKNELALNYLVIDSILIRKKCIHYVKKPC